MRGVPATGVEPISTRLLQLLISRLNPHPRPDCLPNPDASEIGRVSGRRARPKDRFNVVTLTPVKRAKSTAFAALARAFCVQIPRGSKTSRRPSMFSGADVA
jgi:hypothetical protein